MSSSCLSGGGGRTYGFELVDIIKSPCPSPSAWSSHSSSPSSTLSDSSNTPLTISTKRARAPRKRPNQSYSEAAALLSTIYPNLFSTTHLHKLNKHHHHRAVPAFFPPDPSSALLLPPFPPLSDSAVLIRDPSPDSKPSFQFGVKPVTPIGTPANSPSNSAPADPSSDDEFDAGSILDEEVEEGIDSIMGNLSMDNRDGNSTLNSHFNPYLGSLMGFGLAGKFELGFGFRLVGNVRQALRRANDENADWWRSRTVAVGDIVPNVKASTPAASPIKKTNKKKKKKVEKEEAKEDSSQAMAAKGDIDTGCIDASASPSKERLKDGLGLTLNYEEVAKAWSDGGSPFNADGAGSPESSAELIARLAEVELFPDTGGGVREASVQRYKEKRRTRLFSKKIRYQVRKVNADRRPRMKGRFVRRPSLLHQAIEDESS